MGVCNKTSIYIILPVVGAAVLTSCSDSATAVNMRGYNHMKVLAISTFTVNGAMGPNVDTESGGGETCCVSIPKRWRPGLKAKVSWRYDQNLDIRSSLPPDQSVEVDMPEYRSAGAVQIHFYEQHKVKVVISNCSPEHPFYPMSADDLAPWKPFTTKEDMRQAARRGGGSVDC